MGGYSPPLHRSRLENVQALLNSTDFYQSTLPRLQIFDGRELSEVMLVNVANVT
jgi:hypothetical protein